MKTCDTCHGEGVVRGLIDRSIRAFMYCMAAFLVFTLTGNLIYNIGVKAGIASHCLPTECQKPPEAKCLTELPTHCGRIGGGRIVCARKLVLEEHAGTFNTFEYKFKEGE